MVRGIGAGDWSLCPILKEVYLWTSPNFSEPLTPPPWMERPNTCDSYHWLQTRWWMLEGNHLFLSSQLCEILFNSVSLCTWSLQFLYHKTSLQNTCYYRGLESSSFQDPQVLEPWPGMVQTSAVQRIFQLEWKGHVPMLPYTGHMTSV